MKTAFQHHTPAVFKSLNARYKRIRKRPKGILNAALYELKKEQILELEKLSIHQDIDLYYGDESHFSSEGYVPYGWQFPDDEVYIPVEKGFKINVLGIISRDNKCKSSVTQGNIDSDFVIAFFENFSLEINKPTCVILDNASVHRSKKVKERLECWQKRGLYFFYLPPYWLRRTTTLGFSRIEYS